MSTSLVARSMVINPPKNAVNSPASGPPLEETTAIEFKDSFDPKSGWCELIKDIVAMANSGGGCIYVGLFDDGRPSRANVTDLFAVDLADVVNKLRSFTDVNYSSLRIRPQAVGDATIAVIEVQAASTPLVFSKSGNYVDSSGRAKCAFQPGTLYVRHGPKSEPATTNDLRNLIECRVADDRKSLLKNLRQVVEAPANATVTIGVQQDIRESVDPEEVHSVRIVETPDARPALILDPNQSHPHRQKEVVEAINRHLQGRARFTTTDNLAIRRLHPIESNKKFYFKAKAGSPQYSDGYIEWITQQIDVNAEFLANLRLAFHKKIVETNARRKAKSYL